MSTSATITTVGCRFNYSVSTAKLLATHHIAEKFGEVFNLAIWWSRKKITNLNPTNFKSHGTDQLATQVPGIIYAVPAERYLYTPQRIRCPGFLSLRKGNSYC